MKKLILLIILLQMVAVKTQTCKFNAFYYNGACSCLESYFGSQNQADNLACKKCPKNTTSVPGDNTGNLKAGHCKFCMKGFYSTNPAKKTSEVSCEQCPLKSTSSQTTNKVGLDACNQCSMGLYMTTKAQAKSTNNEASASICSKCPDNSTNSNVISDIGIQSCNGCKPGYYISTQANTQTQAICNQCPNYSNSHSAAQQGSGLEACRICLPQYYIKTAASSGKQAECEICPNNSTTSEDLVVSGKGLSQCDECLPGFFVSQAATENQSAVCLPCPKFSTSLSVGKKDQGASVCSKCIGDTFLTVIAYGQNAATCVECPSHSSIKSLQRKSIDNCVCSDLNALPLNSKTVACTCKAGYSGSATPTSPCIQNVEKSSFIEKLFYNSILMVIFLCIF